MGSKLTIWRQGQFYPELGKKTIELPNIILTGPSDHLIKIEGFQVKPDRAGNFLTRNYSDEELDAINTFGVVRMVIDLFEQISGQSVIWSWQRSGDDSPLKIRIRNNDINARFLPEEQCIELDFHGKSDDLIFNCRANDLLAHETGHAIINSIFPNWQNGHVETRGMEEAFCDFLAMSLIISQQDLCQVIIYETGGDLSKANILSLFGVGHGHKDNSFREIRNALNDEKYNKNNMDPYSFCNVLSAILYGFLADLFQEKEVRGNDRESKLFEVGQSWQKIIVQSFLKCNAEETGLAEFAQIIIENAPKHKAFLNNQFIQRGVF